jgi:hypothetical protein
MFLKQYLRVVIWIFVLSSLAQAFAPRATAGASVWGFAPGWQREIAIFDVAFAQMAFLASRDRDLSFRRGVVWALVVLTALVGTNHLSTVVSGQSALLHYTFVGVNFAIAAFGLLALYASREAGGSER